MTSKQRNIIRDIQRLHSRRAPLNISAVKRSHPKLIERVYAIRPFWGWKRALEDAGLDYKKINIELRDYVDCKICGKDMGGLGFHLISQHQVTPEEYLAEYPEAELMCERVRARMSQPRSVRSKSYMLPRWEAIWTPEYVLDRMAEIHRRGYPMNSFWVGEHEHAVMYQAIGFFGSWDAALRRIGLDPRQIRRAKPTEHLAPADVIARLQKRRAAGLPLNSAAVYANDNSLAAAAQRHFGSHTRALRAAGIDPAQVVKVQRHSSRRLKAIFDEARRIAGLRGEAHRQAWLRFTSNYAAIAEQKRFGGWKGIAAQAGVPLERLRWDRFRGREDVLRALRERRAHGKSLQAQRILEEDISLRTAVLKYLGGFEEVYRLFHIQPPRESPWRRVDRAGIVAELRRRARAREALSWKKILPQEHGTALLNRAKELYGSWTAALRAAGLDPSHGRHSPWADVDKDAILAEIKRRKRAGASLGYKAVASDKWGQPLVKRAERLFGSWKAALLSAGIEPEHGYTHWPQAIKADIVTEIRRRQRAGQSLRSMHVAEERHGRAFQDRVNALLGTWNAALRAADIEPVRENSPWRTADRTAILADIQRRHRGGESMATRSVERTKWGGALIKRAKILFGTWAGALIAAEVDLPPGLMSPWPKAAKTAILAEIRRRKRAGESLAVPEIERQMWGAPLLTRTRALFGSWNAAVTTACRKSD